MRSLLKAVALDRIGIDKVFYGSRDEIESWLRTKFDPPEITIMVTDFTGMTVGKKPLGRQQIDWGLRLAE